MSDNSIPFDSVDLLVWSGTGNTRHVAERIAETARTLGAEGCVRTPTSTARAYPPKPTLLGLLAPTHGFTAPWPILKAALTLPNVRGSDAFVLVTRGGTKIAGRIMPGFEGTAAYLPAALLALRGARIRGVGAIDMPLNWTVIVPPADLASVTAIVERGDAQVDEFSRRVLKGEAVYMGLAQLFLGVLILPLSLGYVLIARLILAKIFFADERCIACGLCEKNCPQGAVKLHGKGRHPYWTYLCQNCMRCMSDCPTSAIQGGQAWLLFYGWLISLPVAKVAAHAVSRALGLSNNLTTSAVGFLFGVGWIAVAVWFAYGLLWLGLFVPGLRFLLSRATFTRLYRRYPGPEKHA
jgi:Pyruvate/2-oxoacid:ferredoxin oxidoreductase delta subunit